MKLSFITFYAKQSFPCEPLLTKPCFHAILFMLLLVRRIGQRSGATRAAYKVWQREWCILHRSFFVAGLPLSLENKSDKPRGLGQRPKSRRLHFHLVFDIFLYNCYAYRYWYDNNVKEIKFYGTAKSIRRD